MPIPRKLYTGNLVTSWGFSMNLLWEKNMVEKVNLHGNKYVIHQYIGIFTYTLSSYTSIRMALCYNPLTVCILMNLSSLCWLENSG